jgi:chromosome segregation ATPase
MTTTHSAPLAPLDTPTPSAAQQRLQVIRQQQRDLADRIVPLTKKLAAAHADLRRLEGELEALRRRQMALTSEASKVMVSAKGHRAFANAAPVGEVKSC